MKSLAELKAIRDRARAEIDLRKETPMPLAYWLVWLPAESQRAQDPF